MTWKVPSRTLLILTASLPVCAQGPPWTPDRPWHSPEERQITSDGQRFHQPRFRIESDRVYSLPELIDLAESHNPETRVGWENARAQAAALGVARSELYPALSAVALSGEDRVEVALGSQCYRQTPPALQARDNRAHPLHVRLLRDEPLPC